MEYSDKDAELDKFIEQYGEIYEIYRDDNPLSRAFVVDVEDGYVLSEVSLEIEAVEGIASVDFGGTSTQEFLDVLENIRTGGYIIIIALTLLAIFLISNTIKITIYNRNREISIMRQVGASNSYIRQPFIIEGIFIGIMGSVIPVLLTIFGYKAVYDSLGGQLISGMLVLYPVNPFAYNVAIFLVVIAVAVGLIGSYVSVNRYLRWRR